jgi:predicted Zn-dependent peptidase
MLRFFIEDNNSNKFERKICISKICGMRFIALCCLFGASFLLFGPCYAQQPLAGNTGVLYSKTGNGINIIVMPLPEMTNAEITFYIRSGTVYEPDSLGGVANVVVKMLETKFKNYLLSNKYAINAQNTTFRATSGTERASFRFTTAPANINACLALVRDSLFGAVFTESDFSNTVILMQQQIEDDKRNPKNIFAEEMLKRLFKQDHEKLEIKGTIQSLKSLRLSEANAYFAKYFVANNTIASATGNVTLEIITTGFEQNFNKILKSEFNPELITKVHAFRPIAYSTQFITEDNTNDPEFEICWQFPGTNTNPSASYCAFLLNQMLNDRNNFIQVKAAKMGCKKFTVDYEYSNFEGILRIDIQPGKKNLYATYKFVIDELGRLDKTLLNDEMVNAAKLQFKSNFAHLKGSKEYAADIIRSWVFNDDRYFTGVADSVYALKTKKIHDFIVDFFNESPHVTGLRISKADREALNIDSVFTELDESVSRYVFTYRQNITDLEGADNFTKLHNLLQWLKINTDINIQVNGLSDEHEYNKITDDSLTRFIDSLPRFVQISRNKSKKAYLRPETVRALKIVKYLYDNGIAADRLSGTSMPFKSSNKMEAEDNMKCTLTLEKYHKTPSLFEYHYGHKKDEPAPVKSSDIKNDQ